MYTIQLLPDIWQVRVVLCCVVLWLIITYYDIILEKLYDYMCRRLERTCKGDITFMIINVLSKDMGWLY